MTEEIKISKKDVAACNYWKACDYYKQLKHLEQENNKLKEKIIELSEKKGHLIVENNTLKEAEDKYKFILEEIREDMEQDTTCESRECGCDDYAECLNCIKETILNKINEVLK